MRYVSQKLKKMVKNIQLLAFGLLTVSAACFSCKDKEIGIDALKIEALETYADIVLANYEDSYSTANTLKVAIDAFVAGPTAEGFQACKNAWLAARIPYGQTEAFRFYGGPIDDADGPEGLINAWPMDEAFIDYVASDPNTGLINNPALYPTISEQLLSDLNESISEESIFTGYHAIEFLLWGQDLSASSAGTRPYTDYVPGGTATNPERRGQYLKAVANLLLTHLAQVRDEWQNAGAYRNQFLNTTDTKITLGFIFTSIGKMSKGELSGERMFVAVETKDQENEHSCFADNTIVDIKMNFQGLKNIYFGQYSRTIGTTITGSSLDQVAQRVDKSKAQAMQAAFDEAEAKINAIPGPFDQSILNDQASILAAVEALRTLSDRSADVALAIGAQ